MPIDNYTHTARKISDSLLYKFAFDEKLPEVKSRTQDSRPRPRTQKNPGPRTALPRTHLLEANDRNARGQGQAQRTQGQVFSKKRSSKFFSGDLQKRKTKRSLQTFREVSRVFLHNFKNEQIKCTSHYMGILQYKPSRRGSASVLC